MKISLLLLCALCAARLSCAQDSLQVTFSEEKDTLVKQRFVDRFENVFMTKVPSRNMFKLDISSSELTGRGLYAGYEFKIIPALSLEVGVYGQTNKFNGNLWYEIRSFSFSKMSLWTRFIPRYYFNMNRRIRSGLNANNFTGAYAGFRYDQSFRLSYGYGYRNKNIGRVGLLFGYQGRLFNYGHFDFNVGLFNKESSYDVNGYSIEGFVKPKNFILSTQTSIGFAIGDWKRKKLFPLCDVLVCDEQVRGHLKLQIPDVAIGLKHQRVRIGTDYERKLGRSPWSLTGSFNFTYYNYDAWAFSSGSVGGGISLRSYFLQNFLIRKGWGGVGLSGPYAQLSGGYGFLFEEDRANPMYGEVNKPTEHSQAQSASTSFSLGYQQRIFGKFYIDSSIGYGYSFNIRNNMDFLQNTKYMRSFQSNLTVGFTF